MSGSIDSGVKIFLILDILFESPKNIEEICKKLLRDNALSYKPENIVVSNGAKKSLFNALSAILNSGDEVLIPSPCWVSYPEMVRMAWVEPVCG